MPSINRPACLALIFKMAAISDRVRYSSTGSLRTRKPYPNLGYLQCPPYGCEVVKRDAQDRRYLRAIETLRAARGRAGLTQAELAVKLGRRQQFVSKYESGERRLDIIEFMDAATVLELSIESVLRDLEADDDSRKAMP